MSKESEILEELDSLLSYIKRIKDIEKERGIDLITLSKALKNGIWVKQIFVENGKTKNLFFFYENVSLYKDCLYICPIDIFEGEKVYTYQYGITWALTKEELE